MHHIFVDFENVPSVDLSLIGDHDAEVTLLIGEKQRRLELALVRQIHRHAAKVTLIEVGASGRNALDLVLAWHLGKVAERHPADAFFVISKDKDFDPLLRHLRTIGLDVKRVDAFAALPFLTTRGADAAAGRTEPMARRAPPAGAPVPHPETDEERLAKLIDRLQHKTTARPSRRKTLLSHINGFFSNRLSEPKLASILETLQRRGVITLDPQGRVDYPAETAPIEPPPPPPTPATAPRRPRTRRSRKSPPGPAEDERAVGR